MKSENLNKAQLPVVSVNLVFGKFSNGEEFWAYIAMTLDKYEKYLQDLQNNKEINLKNYGEILEWGRGNQIPPEDIIKKMEKEYSVQHDYQNKIIEEYKSEITSK